MCEAETLNKVHVNEMSAKHQKDEIQHFFFPGGRFRVYLGTYYILMSTLELPNEKMLAITYIHGIANNISHTYLPLTLYNSIDINRPQHLPQALG
jgi:hypothetical protein